MKNTIKWFGIIALVAVMGFSMAACPSDDGGGNNSPKTVKYESTDTAGYTYILTVTENTARAAYIAVAGDSYVLTIKKTGEPDKVSKGTVSGIEAGALLLQPQNSGSDPFVVVVSNGQMTGIIGSIAVEGGEEPVTSPGTLTPVGTGGGNPTIPVPIEMVPIQGGTFQMGSPESEPNHGSDETQHSVTLTAFKMSKHQVTQGQYEAVMGNNPSNFKSAVSPETSTANRPVEQVTWYDAVEFCNKLSEQEGLTPVYTITGRTPATGYPITAATVAADWSANGYRLPTEAQWEYACRAGTATAYNTGATISDSTGWYSSNSGSRTHSVGEKPANAYGLYDMHGNVFEWCWDWWENYASGTQTDPTGAVSSSSRVRRGGSWVSDGQDLRSAYRIGSLPGGRSSVIGFRLVCPAQ